MKKLFILLFSNFLFAGIYAQDTLSVAPEFQKAYDKGTRSKTGAPGPKYWQNRADYDIKVNFEPTTRAIKGTVNIVYKNNSPDTLRELWFKLYPNLYKKGSSPKNIKPEDVGDGITISAVTANKKAKDLSSLITEGTNMHTAIDPLLPGKSITLKMDFNYILNKGSHVRTGQVDEGAAFIAYFFPRIAVYDDIDGWNQYPYRGSEEFYNDFCHFKAKITVPDNYVVWATGDLQNPKSVITRILLTVSKKRNATMISFT